MKILKSYTTRSKRSGETDENSDHIFISESEVEQYRDSMVAYTKRVGYESFATKEQLLENDFYIINPTGYFELKAKTKDMDIDLVAIYITTPHRTLIDRAKKRGDYDSFLANYEKEEQEFKEFENLNMIDYRVLNNESVELSAKKLVKIINKDIERVKKREKFVQEVTHDYKWKVRK